MKKNILYIFGALLLLAFQTSCHRQLARIQPTPLSHYQSISPVNDAGRIRAVDLSDTNQPTAEIANNVEQPASAGIESELVASAKPVAALKPSLEKKMARIQKLLIKTSATEKKGVASSPETKVKKVMADPKGTLGLLGLIFGGASLLLLLVGSGVGILLALAGLVLSILGLKGPRRTMAIIGLILSAISLILLLLVVAALAAFGFGI